MRVSAGKFGVTPFSCDAGFPEWFASWKFINSRICRKFSRKCLRHMPHFESSGIKGAQMPGLYRTYLINLLNPLPVLKHIRPRPKCATGFCRVLVVPGDPMSSCTPQWHAQHMTNPCPSLSPDLLCD